MKKYTLFLLILAFGFGLFNINVKSVGAETSCSITTTLRVGSTGDEVSCLQAGLGLKADGKFGPITRAAVITWQAGNGLGADGVFGAKSRAAFVAHGSISGNFPEGCESASGYSRTTGERCVALPSVPEANPLPAGCTSSSDYSSTTGMSCGQVSNVVITGVSGPQSLNVNQVGTWKVTAYDRSGGNLSYSVAWGDEPSNVLPTVSTEHGQTATFTHSYATAGIYTPKFTVTNNIVCFAYPCPNSASTSLSVNVGGPTTQHPTIISISSVTVVSPNGGEAFTAGQQIEVRWRTNNISTNVKNMQIQLLYTYLVPGETKPRSWSRSLLLDADNYLTMNDGSEFVSLPSQENLQLYSYANDRTLPANGAFYKIIVGTGSYVWDNYSDESDAKFTINAPTTQPTIISILPAGCTTNTGFSSTTGEPCSNPRTSANFGDNVYLFGSNFLQNNYAITYSSLNGNLVRMSTHYISPTLLSVVISSTAGTGIHGIRLTNDNDHALSNSVSLNFIGTTACTLTAQVTNTYLGNDEDWGFYVKVNATNKPSTSNGWTTNFQGYIQEITAYGVAKLYGNFFLSSGPLQFTPRDQVDSKCRTTITVYPPSPSTPSITTLSPMNGPVGTQVTITGFGFSPNQNMISFGAGSGSNNYVNSPDGKTIVFTVPTYSSVNGTPIQPGVYGVRVTTPNGASNIINFTVTSVSTPTVTISPTSYTTNSNAGSMTSAFAVTTSSSNTAWTVVDNQPWLTLNKAGGIGNSTVGFSFQANPLMTSRTATITVRAENQTATYTFTQNGTAVIAPPNTAA